MLRRLTVLVLPLLAVALVGGALWLTFKGFAPVEIATDHAVERPRYELQNARWTRYGDDGTVELRAQAGRIDYYDDRSMQLFDVQLDRLADTGPWSLKAERGVVPPQQQRMQLLPTVYVEGQRGGQPMQITAPQVWVDWVKQTIESSQPVHMTSPGRKLDAVGFFADWRGERLRFLKNVEMHYVAP
jgi:LPS export ABC transporter protein LptC